MSLSLSVVALLFPFLFTATPASPAGEEVRLRVIYEAGERPDELITLLEYFSPVQAVGYSDRIAPALAAAPSLPTVVVVQPDARDQDPEWFRPLYGYTSFYLLNLDKDRALRELPASWERVRIPLDLRDATQSN
jgi:hypothetical protein